MIKNLPLTASSCLTTGHLTTGLPEGIDGGFYSQRYLFFDVVALLYTEQTDPNPRGRENSRSGLE